MNNKLPKKLNISFPIWGLYDIDGKGFYADTDKMMKEHVERGFNCIRLDDGAGLMHDLDGKPRGRVKIGHAFGEYDKIPRQFDAIGGEGYCDLLERLIKIATSAKKYGVYLILSSWYYLHTYWMCHDKELNDRLFAIPDEDKFMTFAKFLHYIIEELKKRGLDDVIAFVEIFNEADGLYFTTAYEPLKFTDEHCETVRARHEEAIFWLKEKHPDVLVAYDSFDVSPDERQIPRNADVLNFHSYFLWGNYMRVEAVSDDCFDHGIKEEDVREAHKFRRPEIDEYGWHRRIALYGGLKPEMMSVYEKRLEDKLREEYDFRVNKAFAAEKTVESVKKIIPDIKVVCGEGVSYVASKTLLWEEKSELCFKLVKTVLKKYSDIGMWGTVVRTCMGPEDPAWNLIPEKIKELNEVFSE